MHRETFIGVGRNPEGPELPLGLGMRLAQEPKAVEAFGRLTADGRARVVRYIQSARTGPEAEQKVAAAVESLKNNDLHPFGL